MIRGITGFGEGRGPFISIHDAFVGVDTWAGFLPGSDRISLDTHPYFAFNGGTNTDPIDSGTGSKAGGTWPSKACGWGSDIKTRCVFLWSTAEFSTELLIDNSQTAFGVTLAGEFSNGINDCGLYLNGVGGTATYGGDCSVWQDSSNWSRPVKDGILQFALASMDSLQDWFFWTWKVCCLPVLLSMRPS
jgi:hypothetical protein